MARDMTPRQVAEAYLAAWNAHDADAAAALMADDVTYFDVIVGKPQKGRDAARDKVIKLFVTAAPDLTFKMTGEPIESANGIAYEFTFAGTNTGAWGPDTPATGKPFSFNGVTFMRVENGKIVYQGDWYEFSSRPNDACPIDITSWCYITGSRSPVRPQSRKEYRYEIDARFDGCRTHILRVSSNSCGVPEDWQRGVRHVLCK